MFKQVKSLDERAKVINEYLNNRKTIRGAIDEKNASEQILANTGNTFYSMVSKKDDARSKELRKKLKKDNLKLIRILNDQRTLSEEQLEKMTELVDNEEITIEELREINNKLQSLEKLDDISGKISDQTDLIDNHSSKLAEFLETQVLSVEKDNNVLLQQIALLLDEISKGNKITPEQVSNLASSAKIASATGDNAKLNEIKATLDFIRQKSDTNEKQFEDYLQGEAADGEKIQEIVKKIKERMNDLRKNDKITFEDDQKIIKLMADGKDDLGSLIQIYDGLGRMKLNIAPGAPTTLKTKAASIRTELDNLQNTGALSSGDKKSMDSLLSKNSTTHDKISKFRELVSEYIAYQGVTNKTVHADFDKWLKAGSPSVSSIQGTRDPLGKEEVQPVQPSAQPIQKQLLDEISKSALSDKVKGEVGQFIMSYPITTEKERRVLQMAVEFYVDQKVKGTAFAPNMSIGDYYSSDGWEFLERMNFKAELDEISFTSGSDAAYYVQNSVGIPWTDSVFDRANWTRTGEFTGRHSPDYGIVKGVKARPPSPPIKSMELPPQVINEPAPPPVISTAPKESLPPVVPSNPDDELIERIKTMTPEQLVNFDDSGVSVAVRLALTEARKNIDPEVYKELMKKQSKSEDTSSKPKTPDPNPAVEKQLNDLSQKRLSDNIVSASNKIKNQPQSFKVIRDLAKKNLSLGEKITLAFLVNSWRLTDPVPHEKRISFPDFVKSDRNKEISNRAKFIEKLVRTRALAGIQNPRDPNHRVPFYVENAAFNKDGSLKLSPNHELFDEKSWTKDGLYDLPLDDSTLDPTRFGLVSTVPGRYYDQNLGPGKVSGKVAGDSFSGDGVYHARPTSKSYKVKESGNFGELNINLKKLNALHLVAKKGNKTVLDLPIPMDLFDLLTKRFDPKRIYDKKAIEMFREIAILAGLPAVTGLGYSKKSEILQGGCSCYMPPPRNILAPPAKSRDFPETQNFQGTGSYVKYYDKSNPNELAGRMKIIIGAIDAGNDSKEMLSELSELIDILEKLGVIEKKQVSVLKDAYLRN